jgi:Cache domain
MKKRKIMNIRIRLGIFGMLPVLLILLLILPSCENKHQDLNLDAYQYQDTKELLKFVHEAAKRFEKEGLQSLQHFVDNREFYRGENYYLYIYKWNGTNVFHAGMPHFEGTSLVDVIDKNGKKITTLIQEALQNKNNPHAWVHYSWWAPGKFYPVPKSSCQFKVTTKDGDEYFIGGGLEYPQEEKEFIRIIVDSAVDEIKQKGISSLEGIADPLSQYNYREVRVFAFQENGNTLISPVVDDSLQAIELLECVDEVNHKPFVKAMKQLKTQDSTWEVFMAKSLYQRVLVKKCLYIRKVELDGEIIFVAAITDLPQPPWAG